MGSFTLLSILFVMFLPLKFAVAAPATNEPLFTVSFPKHIQVHQKTVITVQVNEAKRNGGIPSVAVTWLKHPQGEIPTVLVGAPETLITFKEPGHYEGELTVTIIQKTSCALASVSSRETQHFTVVIESYGNTVAQ